MKFLSISLLTITVISAFSGVNAGDIDAANVENAANNRPGANGSGVYRPQHNLGENDEMSIPAGEMDGSNVDKELEDKKGFPDFDYFPGGEAGAVGFTSATRDFKEFDFPKEDLLREDEDSEMLI